MNRQKLKKVSDRQAELTLTDYNQPWRCLSAALWRMNMMAAAVC